jgi:hypothetical protein
LNCSCDDIEDILKALATTTCRLSTLDLDGGTRTESQLQLVQYLPHLCYLRHLSSSGYSNRGYEGALVPALRKNGSLYSVGICAEVRTGTKQVQAYMDRNRLAPLFLGSAQRDEDDDAHDTVMTTLFLFPSIFHVVKPAARTAPGVILIGLLASSDCVGPFKDRKRSGAK